VVIDVKKAGRGKYEVWLDNGTRATGLDAVELAREVEGLGVGEVVINSIDNDGLMKGYDLDLVEAIRGAINIPMTVLGGAGSLQDIKTLLDRFGIIGAAAGSLFVFKGAYRAVLINYPNPSEKQRLLA
jgi:cyclase